MSAPTNPSLPFPVIGIGASAGGLEAFKSFFANVPANCGMAFVLVQHLSPEHPSMISELLSSSTTMPAVQVTEPVTPEPNHIYVIAPNTELILKSGILCPTPPIEPHGNRWPIDLFFRSLAEDQGENAAGIILSGAGSDGAVGLQSIRKHGGQAIVQSPESCRHDSMPRSALATGIVDQVLPVEEIGPLLQEFFKFRSENREKQDGVESISDITASLPGICKSLSEKLGHDFSRYKQSTLIRRIQRRMQMLRLAPASAYVGLLEKDEKEIEQLFKDLLIGVTEFFRDPEAFELLSSKVIPKLFQNASSSGTIRVWVAGCATGQEAYSVAILLMEHMARTGSVHPIQIFATDIDSEALETARQGLYGDDIVENVSQERLRRYFRRQDGGYQVVKEVREMCIFSAHNLINDPPFSRMDLVTCRNVLIYFEAGLQQRIIPLFHYALKSGGYLFLGPAESLGSHADLFPPIDKRLRIFQAKSSSTASAVRLPRPDGGRSNRIVVDSTFKMKLARERDAKEIHERALLDLYVPPSVLIDANGDVLHYVRRTSQFLEPPVGSPSHNIFDLVRDDLRMALRGALNQARTDNEEAIKENIELESNGSVQRVSVIVRPLRENESALERFIVIFREEGEARTVSGKNNETASVTSEEKEAVNQLERELRATKEWLQSTIEELENSNEELKSSNEELISINEEYQSANESLQTSKEELQSLNEELETVNTELSKKVEELDRINADMRNVFVSTGIATLILDRSLRIKKFTPAATDLFNLIETDIGRPILDITAKFSAGDVLNAIDSANEGEQPSEIEIFKNEDGSWYLCRIVPYRTAESGYDGVVASFIDISKLKSAETSLRETIVENEKLHEIGIAFASELDLDTLVQTITDVATSVTKAEIGAFFYNVLDGSGETCTLFSGSGISRDEVDGDRLATAMASYQRVCQTQGAVCLRDATKIAEPEAALPFLGVVKKSHAFVSCLAVPVVSRGGKVIGGLLFGHRDEGVFDAHAQSRAEGIAGQAAVAVDNARMVDNLRRTAAALAESDRKFRQLADSMPQIIWAARPDGFLDYYNQRWYEVTGLDEVTGGDTSWQQVLHPDDVDRCTEAWYASVSKGEPYEVRFRMKVAGLDDYRWFLARALPVRDESGQIIRWFGSATDIEEMANAEAALRLSADRKDDFLAMLGHELRNPLAPMKIGFHLLALPETTQDKARDLRAMLERQVDHLTRIVDDLLDVSRIARGKILLRREPIDVLALAESAVADQHMLFQKSGLELHLKAAPDPLWINGDPTRISQIISNLLHNACKFTDRGGEVHVSLEAAGDRARIRVKDTGAGMDPASIQTIFQPFSQTNTTIDRSRGGLGLGLALVKGLVELHGGDVSVTSPGLGQGTTVTVEIPLTETRPVSTVLSERGIIPARSIVLVEDNVDAADALSALLVAAGHRVRVAGNGLDGLALIKSGDAEVVICDIGLPGDLDGYGVARKIREWDTKRRVLLVGLSGYGQEQDRKKAIEAGFDHYFAKPISLEQLEKILS